MLFANIEMFIAINKFVSDLFIAINKFHKMFLFIWEAYRLYLKVVALVSITTGFWFAIRSNVSPTPDVRWRRRCGRGSRACRCGR